MHWKVFLIGWTVLPCSGNCLVDEKKTRFLLFWAFSVLLCLAHLSRFRNWKCAVFQANRLTVALGELNWRARGNRMWNIGNFSRLFSRLMRKKNHWKKCLFTRVRDISSFCLFVFSFPPNFSFHCSHSSCLTWKLLVARSSELKMEKLNNWMNEFHLVNISPPLRHNPLEITAIMPR